MAACHSDIQGRLDVVKSRLAQRPIRIVAPLWLVQHLDLGLASRMIEGSGGALDLRIKKRRTSLCLQGDDLITIRHHHPRSKFSPPW